MIKGVLKYKLSCPKHIKYKAIDPPKGNCSPCTALYEVANSYTKMFNAIESAKRVIADYAPQNPANMVGLKRKRGRPSRAEMEARQQAEQREQDAKDEEEAAGAPGRCEEYINGDFCNKGAFKRCTVCGSHLCVRHEAKVCSGCRRANYEQIYGSQLSTEIPV